MDSSNHHRGAEYLAAAANISELAVNLSNLRIQNLPKKQV